MMLAEPDEIDAELVSEDSFVDDVANNLRMRLRRAILVQGNVAECIEPEFKDMVQRSLFSLEDVTDLSIHCQAGARLNQMDATSTSRSSLGLCSVSIWMIVSLACAVRRQVEAEAGSAKSGIIIYSNLAAMRFNDRP